MRIRDKREQDLFDQYAGLAMQVLLTDDPNREPREEDSLRDVAMESFSMAEQMIKVRREWEEYGQ